MKKRAIAILLVLSTVISLLSGCGKKENSSSASGSQPGQANDYVTRGEWVSMLAQAFSMDNYQSQLPYYTDVTSGDEIFSYVQSTAEWNVLSIFSGETLEKDREVTRDEVGSTAAIAAGCGTTGEDSNGNATFDPGDSVGYAVEHGIIKASGKSEDKMTQADCEAAIEAARTAYFNAHAEEKIEVTPAANIADLSSLSTSDFITEGNRFTLPKSTSIGGTNSIRETNGEKTVIVETADGQVEVQEGEVFVTAPTREHPAGVAYKVSSIEESDGEIIVITEAPTLADLYDELTVHTTVSADPHDIIWAPGVAGTAAMSTDGNSGEFEIMLLSNGTRPLSFNTSMSKNFEFSSGSFEKKWSNKNSSAVGGGPGAQALENSNFVYDKTPSMEDFGNATDSWTKDLSIENKFSGGYKITGNISINSLIVTTDVEYKKTKLLNIPYGVEEASLTLSSDINATLRLEGNLSEELRIATVPIPIAATGLSVSIDLYLYADASGSLEVRANLGNSAKVTYANSKIKNSAESHASAEAEAAIEIDFGAKLSATLDALGIVKIMDVGVRAGGNLTAHAFVGGECQVEESNGITTLRYSESMNIQADLYVPIIKISCGGGGTLIGSLGLSKTWTIMDKDKGAKRFELLNYSWIFWEETVIKDKDGNITNSDSSGDDRVGATDETRLDLKSYVVTLDKTPVQLELDLPAGAPVPAVVWTSDNPNIATVDRNGLVSPVGTGTTTITVSLQSDPNVYVKCAVYVTEVGENNWQFLPADTAYHRIQV